jgi:hypothetical protein
MANERLIVDERLLAAAEGLNQTLRQISTHVCSSIDRLSEQIEEAGEGSDLLGKQIVALNRTLAIATWVGAGAALLAAAAGIYSVWASLGR